MFNKNRFLLISLVIIYWASSGIAANFIVTNTNDSGAGSLRQAMLDVESHAGADSIVFNIPASDPNYNNSTGVWSIQPAGALPVLNQDSTTIDGRSQSLNQGDSNSNGPEIEIDGSHIDDVGFRLQGSAIKIQGLVINRFAAAGIMISDIGNKISGNYIGTNATGNIALPNKEGVFLFYEAKFNVIGGSTAEERNLISGNSEYGIYITDPATESNEVKGNYIGTDKSGETNLGNVLGGIYIINGANNNIVGGTTPAERNIISGSTHHGNIYTGNGITIEEANGNIILGNFIGTNKDGNAAIPNIDYGIALIRSQYTIIGGTNPGEGNVISGNTLGGVFIRFITCTDNIITGNYIGTDASGLIDLGNFREGIFMDYGARDNIIGPGNIIKNNGDYGVICRHDTTFHNTITQNSITNHEIGGIILEEDANMALAPPNISEVSSTQVSGTVFPDCIVEIFSDISDEGAVYEGSVTSDALGNFLWSGMASGPVVTATATDTAGNTSQFSAAFSTIIEDSRRVKIPDSYSLQQNFPNPFNPTTEIQYALSQSGFVDLKIFNSLGGEVKTLVHKFQNTGYHKVAWNGQDVRGKRVSSGIYYYRLEVGDYRATKKLVLIK